MFTGIVEGVARVLAVEDRRGARRVVLAFPGRLRPPAPGGSVAVAGVCLTVEARRGGTARFTAIRETLKRTTLGRLGPGDPVNVERCLRAGDPIGGHFVLGHVEGLGRVVAVRDLRGERRLRIALPVRVPAGLVVGKGSIAVDGVSLTVAARRRGGFEVALIPFTLARTTLSRLRPGDRVNLEFDVLAKHVLAARRGGV